MKKIIINTNTKKGECINESLKYLFHNDNIIEHFNIIYDTSHNITFLNSKDDGSYIYNNKSLNDGCIIRHGSNSLADVTSIDQDNIDYTSNDETLFSILKK